MKILIIDDEAPLAELISIICQRHGDHEVKVALSLSEAKTILGEFKPDLVITDNNLSDGDSVTELLPSLLEKGIRVCLMSGKEVKEHGARWFLHKPVPGSAFIEVLDQADTP
jgi:DNA-binding response OmpR family regulator